MKRLKFKLTKKEVIFFQTLRKLGITRPLQLEKGGKIRASYLDVPYWFYGLIERTVNGRFVDLKVEKTKLKMFIGRTLCFCIDDCQIEEFDY